MQWSVQVLNSCDWSVTEYANTNSNISSFLVYWWTICSVTIKHFIYEINRLLLIRLYWWKTPPKFNRNNFFRLLIPQPPLPLKMVNYVTYFSFTWHSFHHTHLCKQAYVKNTTTWVCHDTHTHSQILQLITKHWLLQADRSTSPALLSDEKCIRNRSAQENGSKCARRNILAMYMAGYGTW